jgi:hypothetical protein
MFNPNRLDRTADESGTSVAVPLVFWTVNPNLQGLYYIFPVLIEISLSELNPLYKTLIITIFPPFHKTIFDNQIVSYCCIMLHFLFVIQDEFLKNILLYRLLLGIQIIKIFLLT